MTVIQNHPFKVGDRVRMTDKKPSGFSGPPAHRLNTYGTVAALGNRKTDGQYWMGIKWDSNPNTTEENGGAWIAERFEKIQFDFEPGDRIEYIATNGDHSVRPGDTGTVGPKGIHNDYGLKNLVDVVWDRPFKFAKAQGQSDGGYYAKDFRKIGSVTSAREVVDTAIRQVLEAPVSLDNLAEALVDSVTQALNERFNLT